MFFNTSMLNNKIFSNTNLNRYTIILYNYTIIYRSKLINELYQIINLQYALFRNEIVIVHDFLL